MSELRSSEDLENHRQPDPLVHDCVNYDQINGWIHHCEANHGPRCNNVEYQFEGGVFAQKLVDVIECKVIDAPKNARYFALSYVWGGVTQFHLSSENAVYLSQPRSLLEHIDGIPVAIRDAMSFVRGCNERYVWVDSLCIVQDDKMKKYAQIEQMGAIYNGAIATLVAGTGEDANAPLAGVRPNTRIPETKRPTYHEVYLIEPGVEDRLSFRRPRGSDPYEHLGRRIKGQQLDLFDRLSKSVHNTRAWTYQERLLSRRCLYFMDNMVYFHCRKSIRAENKFAPYTSNTRQIRPLSLFIADPIFSGDPLRFQRTLFAIYAEVVKEYTSKKLSYEHDIVGAFSGISAAMGKICSWRFLYGLPERLLDFALLWTPTNNFRGRRQSQNEYFPSWSWCGWDGEADYNTLIRHQLGFEAFFADTLSAVPYWNIYTPTDVRCVLSNLPLCPTITDLRNEVLPLSPDMTHIITQKSKQKMSPVLVFDAFTLPFELNSTQFSSQRLNGVYGSLQQTIEPMRGKHYLKFTRTCRYMDRGWFLVGNENDITEVGSSNCDIVILSFNKKSGEEHDAWDYSRVEINFMLVKWNGDVAERVAMGATYNSFLSHITSSKANIKRKKIILM